MTALEQILAQMAAAKGAPAGGPVPAAVQQNPLGTALQELQHNFMAYTQHHGGAGEPFAPGGSSAKTATLATGDPTTATQDPLTRALSTVAQVNLHQDNPRAGKAYQEYDLADGRRAHVYYDKKGKRRVFAFRPGAAVSGAGTGGVAAPA